MRAGLLGLLLAILLVPGCLPSPPPASSWPAKERLPAEVEHTPESAMKASPRRPSR